MRNGRHDSHICRRGVVGHLDGSTLVLNAAGSHPGICQRRLGPAHQEGVVIVHVPYLRVLFGAQTVTEGEVDVGTWCYDNLAATGPAQPGKRDCLLLSPARQLPQLGQRGLRLRFQDCLSPTSVEASASGGSDGGCCSSRSGACGCGHGDLISGREFPVVGIYEKHGLYLLQDLPHLHLFPSTQTEEELVIPHTADLVHAVLHILHAQRMPLPLGLSRVEQLEVHFRSLPCHLVESGPVDTRSERLFEDQVDCYNVICTVHTAEVELQCS